MNARPWTVLLAVLLPLTLPPRLAVAAEPVDDPYAALALEDEVGAPVSDPFEGFNRSMFALNRTLNKFILRPVAKTYQTIVPDPVEEGLSNVFDNLRVVPRVAGSLLQGKPERALRETGRFAVDTTIGIGGFFRPSKDMPALLVPKEDIGQAFGVWGIGEGPYLVLPLLGPATLRDLAGSICDRAVNPLQEPFDVWNDWAAETAFGVADTLVDLPGKLNQLDQLGREAIDAYAAVRNVYVNYRRAVIKQ